jgi:formyltetrahydrofolate deformylase
LRDGFAPIAERFGMDYSFFDESVKSKVVVMVSRFGHCLNDLLYRSRIGALPVQIVAVCRVALKCGIRKSTKSMGWFCH